LSEALAGAPDQTLKVRLNLYTYREKIKDAKITLASSGLASEKTNVGFVFNYKISGCYGSWYEEFGILF